MQSARKRARGSWGTMPSGSEREAAPGWVRYGFALLAAALAFLLTFLFGPFVERSLFLFFFAAVAVSAWCGGLGPALVTTVLAVVSANYFFIPPYDRWAKGPGDLLALAVFGVVAVILSRLSESRRAAVRRLLDSESRFRTMADTAPVLIWMSDAAGQRTYFNRPWLEFTGRSLGEESGNGWIEDLHPEDIDPYHGRFHSALSSRESFTVVYRLRRADGEYRWVLDTGVPRVAPEGNFAGYIGSGIDITRRKETEDTQQFLLEAARLLASSLDLEATLQQIVALLVPRFADYCVVHLLAEDGSFRQAVAGHADPEQQHQLDELGRLYHPKVTDQDSVIVQAWASGTAVLIPDTDHETSSLLQDPGMQRLGRELGTRSYAVLPLGARGSARGTIYLATARSGRRYDREDRALRELFELFADRAGLALDNARLFTEVRLAHERDLRTSRLESQLMQARLETLRAQLNPHFLFNALNTIAMLVRRQASAKAVRGIVGLSQMLRQVLDRRSSPEVRLGEELALVEHYLTVEQLRFQDRLAVSVNVPRDVLDAWVPSLILQPLVENAVRHGIDRQAGAGLIEIVGRRHNGTLRLEVRDSGPGFPDGWDPASSAGIGLANTQERLRRLYGAAHGFKVRNPPAGGAVVSVTVPFRTESPV